MGSGVRFLGEAYHGTVVVVMWVVVLGVVVGLLEQFSVIVKSECCGYVVEHLCR